MKKYKHHELVLEYDFYKKGLTPIEISPFIYLKLYEL